MPDASRFPPSRPIVENGSQASVAGRQTTILESTAMGAGVLIVGLSYIAGVIGTGGLIVTVGIVLTLSAVMFIVAGWLGNRTDKRLRLLTLTLDRHERDRVDEYGAIMRKIEAHASASQMALETTGNAVLAIWKRQAEDVDVLVKLAGLNREIADSIAKDARILTVLVETQERAICKASRDAEAIRGTVDGLGETIASELLAINGATNGLRSAVDDVLKRVAPDRPMPPVRMGPESDDPIADLIQYKTESGDLWVTSPPGAIVAVDPAYPDETPRTHLPYCAIVNHPLAGPNDCTCTDREGAEA